MKKMLFAVLTVFALGMGAANAQNLTHGAPPADARNTALGGQGG